MMTNTFIQDPAMENYGAPTPNSVKPPIVDPSTQESKTVSNSLNSESQKSEHESANFNNTPIAEQVKKMKDLLVVNDTANTFSKSARLLFVLAKESAILLWLTLCWGVVALSWVADGAKQLQPKLQEWWRSLKSFGQRESKVELATGTLQTAVQNLVVKAKKQVGVSE
jgi:hypothetical protein